MSKRKDFTFAVTRGAERADLFLVEQNSSAWYTGRQRYIGASFIPTVAGFSPYSLRSSGLINDLGYNESDEAEEYMEQFERGVREEARSEVVHAMDRVARPAEDTAAYIRQEYMPARVAFAATSHGHAREGSIVALYKRLFPRRVIVAVGTIPSRSAEFPWIAASLDRVAWDPVARVCHGIEIKAKVYGISKAACTVAFALQCLQQAYVSALPFIDLVVHSAPNAGSAKTEERLVVCRIYANAPFFEALLRARAVPYIETWRTFLPYAGPHVLPREAQRAISQRLDDVRYPTARLPAECFAADVPPLRIELIHSAVHNDDTGALESLDTRALADNRIDVSLDSPFFLEPVLLDAVRRQ